MVNPANNEQPPGFLCIKDIEKITGRSARTARRIAQTIKQKTNGPYITIEAFCEYTGLKYETVARLLQNKK